MLPLGNFLGSVFVIKNFSEYTDMPVQIASAAIVSSKKWEREREWFEVPDKKRAEERRTNAKLVSFKGEGTE